MDHLPGLYKISKGSILLFNNISKFNFFPNEIFCQSAISNKIISQDINFEYHLIIIIFYDNESSLYVTVEKSLILA